MMELQLELRSQVQGVRANISTDELIEVQGLLARYDGDLKGLLSFAG